MTSSARVPRPEHKGYWHLLLTFGVILALAAAALILWYAVGGSNSSGYAVGADGSLVNPPKGHGPTGALIGGVFGGVAAQVLLVSGVIGLGVESSGVRQSVDRLTAYLADLD